MKRKYKILWGICLVELVVLEALSSYGFRTQSWVGTALGTLLTITPALIALFFQSNDTTMTKRTRIISKVVFNMLIIFYAITAIATAIYGIS